VARDDLFHLSTEDISASVLCWLASRFALHWLQT